MRDSIDPSKTNVTQFEPRDDERVDVHHHWDPDDPETVVLTRLFVDPDARRKGIGTAVLDALKYVFYEEGAVTLEVRGYAFPGTVPFLKANEFIIDSYEEREALYAVDGVQPIEGHIEAHFHFKEPSEESDDEEPTSALEPN